jgi:hypothetical protein
MRTFRRKSRPIPEFANSMPGALDSPGTKLLILSGHDTNLSNLSGMLGPSRRLPGYQPDDTPPGGALIFSLWQQPDTAPYSVRAPSALRTLPRHSSGVAHL